MTDELLIRRLEVLDDQQSAITAALACMNDGRWLASTSGADSVEAWLVALNPTWVSNLWPRAPLYQHAEPPPPETPHPTIRWIGSPHYTDGHRGMSIKAIVIHTMSGTLAGSDAWFNNPRSQVSSHYGIGLDGAIHQYVRLSDSSWANGILQPGNQWVPIVGNGQNPNNQSITIETEDRGSGLTPVSEAMYVATRAVCQIALHAYPSIRYLFSHRIVSPGSRPQCCGNRWWGPSQQFQHLAADLGLEAHY